MIPSILPSSIGNQQSPTDYPPTRALSYHAPMPLSLSHGRSLDVTGYGIAQEDLPPYSQGPIDLRVFFPESRRGLPLELEIGSGKGTFLIQQATTESGQAVNFLGLEYARAFWKYAADRARRHQLPNVRLVHAEASYFLRNYCSGHVFHRIHIYFPDPWPKKRHQKRRLIQAPFLRELHRLLRPPGQTGDAQVRIATDHGDYHQWMLEHAAQVADLYEMLPFENPESAQPGELVGTNFERKYRREGRPFHALILRRRG